MPNQYLNYRSLSVHRYKMDVVSLQAYRDSEIITSQKYENVNVLSAPTWAEFIRSAIAKLSIHIKGFTKGAAPIAILGIKKKVINSHR
jgi:hypothetical protein